MHVAHRLLEQGVEVVGIDNLNDYYDVSLKEDRLKQLTPLPNFHFVKLDMADRDRRCYDHRRVCEVSWACASWFYQD